MDLRGNETLSYSELKLCRLSVSGPVYEQSFNSDVLVICSIFHPEGSFFSFPFVFLVDLLDFFVKSVYQRWSRGHKARGQGQGQGHKKNPRPRPRPRTAFPRTDTLEAKDRNARGQGQGPRTQSASALQKKKKKKGLHKNFSSDLHEKTLSKKFFNRSTKF